MHINEFILMNIHEDEYFWIMVVKTLICDLRNEKTDSSDNLNSQKPTTAAAILQAYANNLTNSSGFEGCYLRNRCGFVRHQHVDISRQSILEAGVDAQFACIGQDNVLLRVFKHQRVHAHLV